MPKPTKYELVENMANRATKKAEGDTVTISARALECLVTLASYASSAEIHRLTRTVGR